MGSTVGVGVGSSDGDAEASGVALGLTEGSADVDGSSVAGAGVTGSGVAESTGLCRGVEVGGSAVWAAGTEIVGVATGGRVARCPMITGNCATTCEAANTNAPPSRATVMMVTIRVPVVRIAPRMTCERRSESHEPWARRRARSSRAASRIRSSRSGVGRGIGNDPRRLSTRVLLPISAVHAAHPLTCPASLAASVGPSSSRRKASISARAREQSRAWLTCGFVTPRT